MFTSSIKTILPLSHLLAILAICVLSVTAAQAEEKTPCSPALWSEVKALAQTCTAQLQSSESCDTLQIDRQTASFRLHGQNYRVEMIDSVFSDGGDLNDLLLDGDDGCQLQRRNLPTFGDLLRALSR